MPRGLGEGVVIMIPGQGARPVTDLKLAALGRRRKQRDNLKKLGEKGFKAESKVGSDTE